MSAAPADPVEVDVALPPGWFPLGSAPGVVLTAAAVATDGSAVATMVIALRRIAGLATAEHARAAFAAVAAPPAGVQDLRWCGRDVVAVLTAHAADCERVSADDLRAALRQTAVYAVDSAGSASSDSSAGVASDGCRGSTRTV